MMTVLLAHGADPRVTDEDCRSPAHHAFAHPALMTRLLEAGADCRAATTWGDTPLYWCASNYIQDDDDARRRLMVIEALVARDAGLTGVQDAQGRTAWARFLEQAPQERISTESYVALSRLLADTGYHGEAEYSPT